MSFLSERESFRHSEESYALVEKILKAYPERFNNRSEVIRASIFVLDRYIKWSEKNGKRRLNKD